MYKILSSALWLSLVAPLGAMCPIFLSISLAGKTITESCLEINWGPDCYGPPEWIGVFRQDPSISSMQPAYRFVGIRNKTGAVTTNIKIGKLKFPGGWNRQDAELVPATKYPKGKCLPFYVASYNGTELLAVECLKIQPNWMTQMKGLGSVPIKRLFLPGTHAAGAFINNYSQTKSVLVKDYLVAQHFDVWSQLVFGIRYLDLSIGYQQLETNNYADNFFIVNENMFITPLTLILQDVRRFVKRSGDMVVLDFSSFPIGFYNHVELYSTLFRLIRQELGDVVYEREATLSEDCFERCFDDLRLVGKTVLVLFPKQELPHQETESELLCMPLKRFSTSYLEHAQILDNMRFLFSKKKDSPVLDEGWIFLGVQSMEQSLNTQSLQTTKQRAALLNPKINQWLKGPWGLNANVVAMDYFSNTNIVDVAIHVNAHKVFLLSNKKFVNLEILKR